MANISFQCYCKQGLRTLVWWRIACTCARFEANSLNSCLGWPARCFATTGPLVDTWKNARCVRPFLEQRVWSRQPTPWPKYKRWTCSMKILYWRCASLVTEEPVMDLPGNGVQSAMAFEVAEPYRFNFEIAWEVAHKGELKLFSWLLSNHAFPHLVETFVSNSCGVHGSPSTHLVERDWAWLPGSNERETAAD